MHRGTISSAGVVGVVAVVALALTLGPASAAWGAGSARSALKAKKSGPEKVFVLPANTTSAKHPGKILMTGTIGDYGLAVATTAKGKPTKSGSYRDLELKKGTILVNISPFLTAIDKAFPHATFDSATCSLSVTVSASITIVSGTKAYAGVTGSLTLSGFIAEIGSRAKSGACTTKTSTPPLATSSAFSGSGTVTLP